MTKRQLESYARRFAVFGVIIIGIGILNWFRGEPENKWRMASMVGCLAAGLLQFLLAYRLHKKGQALPG
ncbi:MAG: hypothetical protein M3444_08030 [Acidobacteriota bacterium]|nr:hypothetical protein [Acidobacteriota bacterium]MDQ5836854.1 hypothetical protein [Acidobacteriota bacterium]